MPSPKDMEFAKILMNKNILSKIEIQRHLNDIDLLLQEGRKISLDELLCERNILSAKEIEHLSGPKKRILQCGKCNAKYHAREEDIGTKFKCKSCGAIVTVPAAGQSVAPREEVTPDQEMVADLSRPDKIDVPVVPEEVAETQWTTAAPKTEGQREHRDSPPETAPAAEERRPEKTEEPTPAEKGTVPLPHTLPLELLMVLDREAPIEDDAQWWSTGEEESEEKEAEEGELSESQKSVDYLTAREEAAMLEWAQESDIPKTDGRGDVKKTD